MTPVIAAGSSLWYLTRGSATVSLVLLTASVVLGILTSVRWASRQWPRFVVEGLHRNISLAVLVFVAIHVATTVFDGYVPIGWVDTVVPFRSGYRPVWVGLGAVAVDLLLALTITSLLRVRIGHRTWRNIHWLAYACWPIALVHGLGAGTDAPARWMVVLDVAAVASVFGALVWRIWVRRPAHPAAAPLALALSGVVPLAVAAFAWTGPLQADWSHGGARLGQGPASSSVAAASGNGATAAAAGSSGSASSAAALPIDVTITGTRDLQDNDGARVVTLDGRSGGADPVEVRITLRGTADATGGVSLDGGQAAVGPAGAAPTWTGPVTGLQGSLVAAQLTGPGGQHAELAADLVIDRSTGDVRGRVQVTASTASTGSGRTSPTGDEHERQEGDH